MTVAGWIAVVALVAAWTFILIQVIALRERLRWAEWCGWRMVTGRWPPWMPKSMQHLAGDEAWRIRDGIDAYAGPAPEKRGPP